MSKANKTRSINKQTNKKKRARKLDEVGPQLYSTELRLGISNTVLALISNHLGNSRKWL